MTIHQNSRDSYAQLDPTSITGRIFQVYANTRTPLTDREVAERLEYKDMNIVRPKINALLKRRRCVEIGNVWDKGTNRKVRLVTNTEQT